jgi:hypothetical protein
VRAALALAVVLAGCARSRPASPATAIVVRSVSGQTVRRGTFVDGEIALVRGQRLLVSTAVAPDTRSTWTLADSAGAVLTGGPLSGTPRVGRVRIVSRPRLGPDLSATETFGFSVVVR